MKKVKKVINDAQKKTISLNHQQVTLFHIIYAIIFDEDDYIKNVIKSCCSNQDSLKKEINENIMKIPSVSGDNLNIFLSEKLLQILENSKNYLNEFNDSYMSPEIVLYSSLNDEKSDTSEILKRYNINKENLKLAIIKYRKGQTIRRK